MFFAERRVTNMKYSEYQLVELKRLIGYLKDNNPYYAAILKNIDLVDSKSMLKGFEKITPITRDNILQNYEDCLDKNFLDLFISRKEALDEIFDLSNVSENFDKKICVGGSTYTIENTSGSSGHPFPIVKSQKEEFAEAMQLLRSRKNVNGKAKVDNGFLLVHKVDEYLKSVNLKGALSELDPVIDYMIEKKPLWIFSSAYVFNRIMLRIKQTKREDEMRGLAISFIETTSQRLLPDEKKDLQDVFGAISVSNYGCREVWNIAYEEKGDGRYYVNDRTLFVELLDDEGSVIKEEGVAGDIVVTSLTHRTLPFVRYFVGDRAEFYYDEVGRVFFKLCEGRTFEKIYGADFSGPLVFRNVLRAINFKKRIQDINNIRIIQDSKNHMIVYLDKEKQYDKEFEEEFVYIFHDCIKHEATFDIDFDYNYPFGEQKSLYKQKIFECHVITND